MDPTDRYAIGLDVGGTKIAGGLALFSSDGAPARPLARRVIRTHPERGGRAVLDDVIQLGRQLAANIPAGNASQSAISAVGVGLCELVDRQGNAASAHCIDWLKLSVNAELSRIAPSAHITLEADVRAAAHAEAVLGAGRGLDAFLYVTIGTGISCCLMIKGRPLLGARGATGTMASSPLWLPASGLSDLPGPTLEELASGPALIKRFNAAGGQATSGQEVLNAVRASHPAATEIVRSATEALGSQLAVLVGTLDPEALIIGGGLGLSEGPYWDWLAAATRRRIWSDHQRDLPILQAATGPDAGWLGGALAALDRANHTTASGF